MAEQSINEYIKPLIESKIYEKISKNLFDKFSEEFSSKLLDYFIELIKTNKAIKNVILRQDI
jgi:hypothetical protein